MPPNSQQLPKALVVHWNSQTLRALCPYCLYSHGHGFPSSRADKSDSQGWMLRTTGFRRRSDCAGIDEGGDYQLVFPPFTDPLKASNYGWELDRENYQFVTVHSQGKVLAPLNDWKDGRTLLPKKIEQQQASQAAEEDKDEFDDIIESINAQNLEDSEKQAPKQKPYKTPEEIWEELYQDLDFRKKMYISSCILRDIENLELLFRRYPEDGFVQSVDEEGNTGLLLAAIEEDGLEAVRWLHARGDSVDRANNYGRTSLMEAALWGRLKTAQYLVQQSTDFAARDGNDMRALDLAAETSRNSKERIQRAGGVYREPSDVSRRREQIVALLKRLTVSESQGLTQTMPLQRHTFFSRRPDNSLEILRPQELLKLPTGRHSLHKAFATLDRGPNYPFINVMSGYSHPNWENVLDNHVWTQKAEELRLLFGLPEDKSKAAHVEPQLLAYLLDRHSLHGLDDQYAGKALEGVMPLYDLQPVITVSKESFCKHCEQFFAQFKNRFREFNITFHFVGDSLSPIKVCK